MAAFFYFRCMENIQSIYAFYDEYIIGSQLNSDYEDFQLQTLSIYPIESMRSHIDFKADGKDFKLFMKSKSRRLSSAWLTLFLNEIKQHPNPVFFKEKHTKKINEIKHALASKFPQYNFFVDDINEALEELEANLIMDDRFSEKNQKSNVKTFSNPKIKWLGNINVLTTFFYDLMNGQDRNAPLIETTKKDIIDLIVNNFVDSDGNQFSKNTIETNLRDSTPEKKAKRGDRIELGNVKVKK